MGQPSQQVATIQRNACKRQHCSKCPSDCCCIYLFILVYFLTGLLHTCLPQVLLLPLDSCFSCSSLTGALLFPDHFALSPLQMKGQEAQLSSLWSQRFPCSNFLIRVARLSLLSLSTSVPSALHSSQLKHNLIYPQQGLNCFFNFVGGGGKSFEKNTEHCVKGWARNLVLTGAHQDSQQACNTENLPATRALEDWNIFFRRL